MFSDDSKDDCSIIRSALGRDYKIGSLYTIEDDTFINNEDMKSQIQPLKNSYSIESTMIYGKTIGSKIKVLGTQPDLAFSIMSNQTYSQNRFNRLGDDEKTATNKQSSQNHFIQFLREENYRFGEPLMKRAVFKIDLKNPTDNISEIKSKKFQGSNENLYVTEITYGLQIIGELQFSNEKNFKDEELERTFSEIVQRLIGLKFDFPGINNNIKDNLYVDCIDNVEKTHYKSLKFVEFIDYFIRLLNERQCAPIEYKMNLKKRSNIKHVDLNFVFDFYVEFNKHVSSLLDKWHELDVYSGYFEISKRDGIRKALDELYQLINQVTSDLRKEVIHIRKNPKSTLDRINKCISAFIETTNRIVDSWKTYEPSPNQLQDVKFFKKTAVNLIESSWDRKAISLNDGFILCYSLKLKEQNQDEWTKRLGEFMSQMHDNQDDLSFYALNFEICRPQNLTSFDRIQLMKIEKSQWYPLISSNDEVKEEEVNNTEEFNIVLLGETGVGKSTFVNAFANYITFGTLQEASNNTEAQMYLIESCFHYTNDNYEMVKIQVGEAKNEAFIEGQSSTQCAREYSFPIGDNRIVRIIDTPGMGDSRGYQVDKENFDKTVEFLSKFKHINAICFLVKPNNARLHSGFRYCFQELLSHLHKHTTHNLVFCFTNARSTQYRPGETFGALQSFLKQIEATSSDVNIRFDKENIFCVDNEAFRYLMLKNRGVKFSSDEEKNFANSWKNSSENSKKMVEYIMNNLTPLDTTKIIMLNNLRHSNNQLATKAADLLKSMIFKKLELNENIQNDLNSKRQRKTYEGESWTNKDKNINKLVLELLKVCSKLSNLMKVNSLTVYNDDFEAFIEELVKESNQRSMLTKKDEDMCYLFKESLNLFLGNKKKVEINLKSNKLCFRDNESEILADEIYKIEDEFQKI